MIYQKSPVCGTYAAVLVIDDVVVVDDEVVVDTLVIIEFALVDSFKEDNVVWLLSTIFVSVVLLLVFVSCVVFWSF